MPTTGLPGIRALGSSVNKGNPPSKLPISLSEEPRSAYLSQKPDRQVADQEEYAADHMPIQTVIGGEAVVIGR
jgi:hypothetical protein